MANLFGQRMLIAIADSLKSGVQALNDPGTATASRVMAHYLDVPKSAREAIQSAVKDVKGRPAHVLRAYWLTWPIRPLTQVVSRLLVNPPETLHGFDINASQVMTLTTAAMLGSYGATVTPAELAAPLRRSLIHSETHPRGYFDDITVFWDGGADLAFLADFVLPASTITFIRPEPNLNADWIEWGGVDLNCRGLIDALQVKFQLVPIMEDQPESNDRQGGVRTIYGVAPRPVAGPKAP